MNTEKALIQLIKTLGEKKILSAGEIVHIVVSE